MSAAGIDRCIRLPVHLDLNKFMLMKKRLKNTNRYLIRFYFFAIIINPFTCKNATCSMKVQTLIEFNINN